MRRQGKDVFIVAPIEPRPTQMTILEKNFVRKSVKICSEKVGDLSYGSLLDGFLQKFLESKNKLCCKQVSVGGAEESYPLSQYEEETTRYIVGYIIFSLKNLTKEKNRWEVDRVNRGGLIEVTDAFSQFIKLVEYECRKI